MDKTLLSIENFSLRRGNKLLLSDFSLEISSGTSFGIFAPSGFGKSSFLEFLCQFNINSIDDSFSYSGNIKMEKNLRISCAFQDNRLLENLSVYKNLSLILDGKKTLNNDCNMKNLIETYLKKFSLEDKINEKVCKLSGGQKKRLALLRAIISPCQLLFFDEAFTNIEENLKIKILALCKEEIEKRKLALIIISHDISDIEFFTSKIFTEFELLRAKC